MRAGQQRPARRVVSLVPSLTELAWWLSDGEALVGRTRFCVEPAGAVERVPALGGTKDPAIEAIARLGPDLVLANREENRREDIEALQAAGIEVLLTGPATVADAAVMVRDIGELLGAGGRAGELAAEIEALNADAPPPGPRVFVPIWRRPLMALGGDTFGSDVLRCAGAVNVLQGRPRYPVVTMEEMARLEPGLVLLPDEPFRFGERHVAEFAGLAPVRLVSGQHLFWYGPRTPAAIRALRAMIAGWQR